MLSSSYFATLLFNLADCPSQYAFTNNSLTLPHLTRILLGLTDRVRAVSSWHLLCYHTSLRFASAPQRLFLRYSLQNLHGYLAARFPFLARP